MIILHCPAGCEHELEIRDGVFFGTNPSTGVFEEVPFSTADFLGEDAYIETNAPRFICKTLGIPYPHPQVRRKRNPRLVAEPKGVDKTQSPML